LIRARSPGRALARTTHPNEFTRAPSNDPPERPKRTDKGEPGKRAARTCTKPTSGHNLAFLIRARSPGRALARTTRPNEFTRAPSNDPPERPRNETNRQGRAGQTSCTNVHKANLGSQLSIFYTGSFARARPRPNDPPERVHTGALKRPARTILNALTPKRTDKGEPGKRAARTCTKPTSGHNLAFLIRARSPGRALARTTRPNEFTRAPSNDPPERFCMGARTTETNRQGRAGQTSCTNVHKANLGSQLSIFDTGSFARARPRPNDPPERVHTGALKRPARTTMKPKTNDKGEPGKRAARTCTKPTSGHNLAFLIWARSPEARPPRTTRPNEFTRAPSNDPPERPETNRQGRAGQTSCTNVHKANLGSQLSIFDTGSFARARPRPNDPPERVHTGALKRPARTSSQG
jgi:hypothetical protein